MICRNCKETIQLGTDVCPFCNEGQVYCLGGVSSELIGRIHLEWATKKTKAPLSDKSRALLVKQQSEVGCRSTTDGRVIKLCRLSTQKAGSSARNIPSDIKLRGILASGGRAYGVFSDANVYDINIKSEKNAVICLYPKEKKVIIEGCPEPGAVLFGETVLVPVVWRGASDKTIYKICAVNFSSKEKSEVEQWFLETLDAGEDFVEIINPCRGYERKHPPKIVVDATNGLVFVIGSCGFDCFVCTGVPGENMFVHRKDLSCSGFLCGNAQINKAISSEGTLAVSFWDGLRKKYRIFTWKFYITTEGIKRKTEEEIFSGESVLGMAFDEGKLVWLSLESNGDTSTGSCIRLRSGNNEQCVCRCCTHINTVDFWGVDNIGENRKIVIYGHFDASYMSRSSSYDIYKIEVEGSGAGEEIRVGFNEFDELPFYYLKTGNWIFTSLKRIQSGNIIVDVKHDEIEIFESSTGKQ